MPYFQDKSVLTFAKRKSIFFSIFSQVDAFGERILQEPAGKCGIIHHILQESTGSRRNRVAVFRPETGHSFSDDFRSPSSRFLLEVDQKSQEKIRVFSDRNTATLFQRIPVFSCRNLTVLLDLGS